MRNTVLPGSFIVIVLATISSVRGESAERVLTGKVIGNRQVLLDAARISDRRGQNLEARFAVIERDNKDVGRGPHALVKSKVFTVTFPSHSHTTHETTLINIIMASVKWSDEKDRHEWHATNMKPMFSAPKEAEGWVKDYEKWWFVGLAISE